MLGVGRSTMLGCHVGVPCWGCHVGVPCKGCHVGGTCSLLFLFILSGSMRSSGVTYWPEKIYRTG